MKMEEKMEEKGKRKKTSQEKKKGIGNRGKEI